MHPNKPGRTLREEMESISRGDKLYKQSWFITLVTIVILLLLLAYFLLFKVGQDSDDTGAGGQNQTEQNAPNEKPAIDIDELQESKAEEIVYEKPYTEQEEEIYYYIYDNLELGGYVWLHTLSEEESAPEALERTREAYQITDEEAEEIFQRVYAAKLDEQNNSPHIEARVIQAVGEEAYISYAYMPTDKLFHIELKGTEEATEQLAAEAMYNEMYQLLEEFADMKYLDFSFVIESPVRLDENPAEEDGQEEGEGGQEDGEGAAEQDADTPELAIIALFSAASREEWQSGEWEIMELHEHADQWWIHEKLEQALESS